jgi:DNA-binding IclR family transcriptional regulator
MIAETVLRARVQQSEPRSKSAGSQLLAKGLHLLRHIARRGSGDVGVRDLARELEWTTTATHRLMVTLLNEGFLEQHPVSLKYRIGYDAFQIGAAYLRSSGIDTVAPPILRSLVDEHGLNAFLGVMREHELVYLLAMQCQNSVALRVAPGSTAPLHKTAMGKIILADQPDEVVLEKLKLSVESDTAGSSFRTKDFLAELATARKNGFATVNEEFLPGLFSVGAAVRDFSGRVVAAISVSRSKQGLAPREIQIIAGVVTEAADRLSRGLGFFA